METLKNDFENNIFLQLTPEQKKYIYNEEKHRIEQSSPFLSKRAKFYIAFYFLGCVLIYFGIAQSLIEFWGTGKLEYKPETNIFESLLNSAIELIRPFLAVFFLTWPFLIIYGLWVWGSDLFEYMRKIFNRNK